MQDPSKYDIGDLIHQKTQNFEQTPPEHIWENVQNELVVGGSSEGGSSILNFVAKNKLLLSFIAITSVAVGFYYFNSDEVIDEQQTVVSETEIITDKIIKEDANISNSTKSLESESTVAIKEVSVANEVSVVESTPDKTTSARNVENKKTTGQVSNVISPVKDEASVSSKDNITPPAEDIVGTSKKNNENTTEVVVVRTYTINASKYEDIKAIIFSNTKGETVLEYSNPKVTAFGYYTIDIKDLPEGVYNIDLKTKKGKKLRHETKKFK